MNIRINKNLKEEFYQCCKRKGFTASKVVKIFINQYVSTGKIPFELGKNKKHVDENLIRIDIAVDSNLALKFSQACEVYHHVNRSEMIRAFMDYCVASDSLPF